ncbi:MAG TPA: hypothetical protein VN248_07455 [Arenimonas sp.]|nr:hypothetical protein [Arenimonas sp.]
MTKPTSELEDFLSRFDIQSVEDVENKIDECEFFLTLASNETQRAKFRWLISAFLNASYSYFEMTALRAYFRFVDSNTSEPLPDAESLSIIRDHVKVTQRASNPNYVTTEGKSLLTKQLYEIRRQNTHHFPLSIMEAGPSLPEDFHLGNMREQGVAILPICREVMALIHEVQANLEA